MHTPRVYLSSTFTDLQEHRRAAAEAIRSADVHCRAMEDYTASDERPLDKCLEDVASCDLYVGLFAHRYGYVPPGQTECITALEYRTARELEKPTLIFVVDQQHPWPPDFVDKGRSGQKLKKLRTELCREHTVEFFKDPAT